MTNSTTELRIANAITSLSALMIPMTLLVLGLTVTGTDLIYNSLPDSLSEWQKVLGAVGAGTGIGLALLTVMGNKENLKLLKDPKEWLGLPLIMVPFESILLMIFFEVFEGWDSLELHEIVTRIFLSCWLPFLVFVMVTLFMIKKRQATTEVKLETKVKKLIEDNKRLIESNEKIMKTSKFLNESNRDLIKYKQALTCRYCQHVSETASAHKNHETRCQERPKKNVA